MKILITGITGNAGREIYRSLYRRKGDAPDRELVAGVRNPSGVVAEPGVEYRTLDFMDESSYDKALDGIDRLFLVRPPAISQVEKSIFPFLEKVKEKGVECVSFLSLVGVENNRITPHYKIEQEIIRLGIDAIFLRPSFFMENLLEAHREEIRDEDRIMIPAGSGKTNFIAVQDIGEAGAITLLEKNCSFKGSSSSEGQRYAAFELTGERSYDYYEIAEILSGVLGRKIRYERPGALRFILYRLTRGDPLVYTLVMTALYTISRLGKADVHTGELSELLARVGKKPLSFEQFAIMHADRWKPETGVH